MRSERGKRGFPPARLVVQSQDIRRLVKIVEFDAIWPLYDSLEAAFNEGTTQAEEEAQATG